jgi:hypothetical protein
VLSGYFHRGHGVRTVLDVNDPGPGRVAQLRRVGMGRRWVLGWALGCGRPCSEMRSCAVACDFVWRLEHHLG